MQGWARASFTLKLSAVSAATQPTLPTQTATCLMLCTCIVDGQAGKHLGDASIPNRPPPIAPRLEIERRQQP